MFDEEPQYTDEEMKEFFACAMADEFMKRNLMNFFYGDMDKIDPDKKKRILDGTELLIQSTPKMIDPSYWKELWKKEQEETIFGIKPNPLWCGSQAGTLPIEYETFKKGTEEFNQLTTIKLPGIDKIRWRYRKNESVKSTRWNRNHTKQAEFYYFWNIECRNAKMYIPLEEQYNTKSGFEEIPVPHLEFRVPFPKKEDADL